jgi:hypothetical protein
MGEFAVVLDFSSDFFFFVPVPKRLSSRLSNRDFFAGDFFSDEFSSPPAACVGVALSRGSATCVSVWGCGFCGSFFGEVQKRLSRNQIFFVCLFGSGVKLTKPPLEMTVV